MIKIKSLNGIVLILFSLIINFSYLDFFFGNQLNWIVYLLLGILLLLNFKVIMHFSKSEIILIISSVIILSYYLMIKIFVPDATHVDMLALVKTTIFFLIFSKIQIDKNQKELMMFIFSLISIFFSYVIILYYYDMNLISAFLNIGEYFYAEKNGFSPLLLVSLIYLTINLSKYKMNIFFLVLGALSLVILQSRTNVLIYIVFLAIYLLFKVFKSKYKNVYIFIFATILLFVVVNYEYILVLFSTIFRLEYLSYVNGNGIIDKFFSGRLSSFVENFYFLEENPFFGTGFSQNVISSDSISPAGIHNVFIRTIVYGGIVYLFLYTIFIVSLLNHIHKFEKSYIIYALLLVAILSSMTELYAPFGPGSNYFYFWLFLIFNLREGENNESRLYNKHQITLQKITN